MFKNLTGSWKTSMIGLVGSILQAYLGGASWKAIAAALPTLIMGLFAKDSDKSNAPNPTVIPIKTPDAPKI